MDKTTENTQVKTTQKAKKPMQIHDGVQVKVKSTYYGKLFYQNPRTGDSTEWNDAGEVQIMTMGDLRAMKAGQVKFFKDHWIMVLGVADYEDCNATCEDLHKALMITQYYTNFIEPTDFNAICSWKPEEIAERVSMMSAGAKENLVVALNTFIKNGTLDSRKKIKAFEDALGCNLYEEE